MRVGCSGSRCTRGKRIPLRSVGFRNLFCEVILIRLYPMCTLAHSHPSLFLRRRATGAEWRNSGGLGQRAECGWGGGCEWCCSSVGPLRGAHVPRVCGAGAAAGRESQHGAVPAGGGAAAEEARCVGQQLRLSWAGLGWQWEWARRVVDCCLAGTEPPAENAAESHQSVSWIRASTG